MLKKLSAVAALIVAFAFVFVSITHACSGLAPMNLAIQQSPMNMGAGDSSPCGKEKPDICKSVRDNMLSVKPSPSVPAQTVAPLQLSVAAPFVLVSTPVTRVSEASFIRFLSFP